MTSGKVCDIAKQFVAELVAMGAPQDIFPLLTPGNLKIDRDGVALRSLQAPPQSGRPRVYPGFTAPEVYSGTVGPGAPVYFMGAVMYLLLTRQVPPDAATRTGPLLPAGDPFSALVNQALEPDPEKRTPDLDQLLRQLTLTGALLSCDPDPEELPAPAAAPGETAPPPPRAADAAAPQAGVPAVPPAGEAPAPLRQPSQPQAVAAPGAARQDDPRPPAAPQPAGPVEDEAPAEAAPAPGPVTYAQPPAGAQPAPAALPRPALQPDIQPARPQMPALRPMATPVPGAQMDMAAPGGYQPQAPARVPPASMPAGPAVPSGAAASPGAAAPPASAVFSSAPVALAGPAIPSEPAMPLGPAASSILPTPSAPVVASGPDAASGLATPLASVAPSGPEASLGPAAPLGPSPAAPFARPRPADAFQGGASVAPAAVHPSGPAAQPWPSTLQPAAPAPASAPAFEASAAQPWPSALQPAAPAPASAPAFEASAAQPPSAVPAPVASAVPTAEGPRVGVAPQGLPASPPHVFVPVFAAAQPQAPSLRPHMPPVPAAGIPGEAPPPAAAEQPDAALPIAPAAALPSSEPAEQPALPRPAAPAPADAALQPPALTPLPAAAPPPPADPRPGVSKLRQRVAQMEGGRAPRPKNTRRKKMLLTVVPTAVLLLLVAFFTYTFIIKSSAQAAYTTADYAGVTAAIDRAPWLRLTQRDRYDYSRARQLMAAGDYEAALPLLQGLEDFEDSARLAKDIVYDRAMVALEEDRFDESVTLLESLGGYGDSAAVLDNIAAYRMALGLESPLARYQAFALLGDFHDSPSQAEAAGEGIYANAMEQYWAGDFEAAAETFASVEGYGNAAAYLGLLGLWREGMAGEEAQALLPQLEELAESLDIGPVATKKEILPYYLDGDWAAPDGGRMRFNYAAYQRDITSLALDGTYWYADGMLRPIGHDGPVVYFTPLGYNEVEVTASTGERFVFTRAAG